MDEPSYGLIVEGFYDEGVFPELVRRILSPEVLLFVRSYGGVPHFAKRVPGLLRDLERVRKGRPVDKALVTRDWRGPDINSGEQWMSQRVHRERFTFRRGVQLCAVRQEIEAWLLADDNAINSVARDRGGRTVSPVHGEIEEIGNAKQMFTQLLSEARLPYDAEVCREIAQRADIETLRRRCPSFLSFDRKVLDC